MFAVSKCKHRSSSPHPVPDNHKKEAPPLPAGKTSPVATLSRVQHRSRVQTIIKTRKWRWIMATTTKTRTMWLGWFGYRSVLCLKTTTVYCPAEVYRLFVPIMICLDRAPFIPSQNFLLGTYRRSAHIFWFGCIMRNCAFGADGDRCLWRRWRQQTIQWQN